MKLTTQLPQEFSEIAQVLQLDAQLLGDYSVKAVNGDHLHSVLGVATSKRDWAPRRVKKLGLIEKEDYEILMLKSEQQVHGGSNAKTYVFTMDAAKMISMSEGSVNGNLVRKYFLHMERTAQQAVRGELPAPTQEPAPAIECKEAQAARELESMASPLGNIIAMGWGEGYKQKLIHELAANVDRKHSTDISKFLPLPEATPAQLEEIDPSKGEHCVRASIGSRELNTKQLAAEFSCNSVTPFNRTLTDLGYQKTLKKFSYSKPSAYQVSDDKSTYASQTALQTGPFRGSQAIRIWYLSMFTESERQNIKNHLLTNHPKSMEA